MAETARERRSAFAGAAGYVPRTVVGWLGLGFIGLLVFWLGANLVNDPSEFFNVLFIGLTNGAVYALVALGYTLVYGILQLINFAHGDVFALGGLVSSSVILTWFGVSGESATGITILAVAVALIVAILFSSTLNVAIELVAYRRLRNAPRLAPLITAVGMSFILQDVGLVKWGVEYQTVDPLIPNSVAFSIGDVAFQWNKLSVLALTIPVLLALSWLVTSTKQGKAMRATSQDMDAAAMMGISVNRTISFTFALAGGLAGAGGLLYFMHFTSIRYDTGFQLGLIAFTAAVLGGIGNLTGAVVGAVCIGLVEQFNEGLELYSPGGDWTRSIVFGMLIATLVFRPEGLLGERTPEGQ
ncbi:MAG TPA: branched-chain amino acid ABC transporter permease [Gaiellaceae bacterium]|nr:branched-chain amino acid ABC transporter permease [Gaiellaceae bacterium]